MDFDRILHFPVAKRRRLADGEEPFVGGETEAGYISAGAPTPSTSASFSYTQAWGWDTSRSLSNNHGRCHPFSTAGDMNITNPYFRDGLVGGIYDHAPPQLPLPRYDTSQQYGPQIASTQYGQDIVNRSQCQFESPSNSISSVNHINIAQQQTGVVYPASPWGNVDVPRLPHDMYSFLT